MASVPLSTPLRDPTARAALARVSASESRLPLMVTMAEWIAHRHGEKPKDARLRMMMKLGQES